MKRFLSLPKALRVKLPELFSRPADHKPSVFEQDTIKIALTLLVENRSGSVCMNDEHFQIKGEYFQMRDYALSLKEFEQLLVIISQSEIETIHLHSVRLKLDTGDIGIYDLPINQNLTELRIHKWSNPYLLNAHFAKQVCASSYDQVKYQAERSENTKPIILLSSLAFYKSIKIVNSLFDDKLFLEMGTNPRLINLEKLMLPGCDLTLDSLSQLNKVLPNFLKLHSLNLTDNVIYKDKDSLSVWKGFIETLEGLGEFECLILSDTNLGTEVARLLGQYLEKNPKLSYLDVSNNLFHDVGIQDIFRSIIRNTNLEKLHIQYNKSDWNYAQPIRDFVLLNHSLTEVKVGSNNHPNYLRSNQKIKNAFTPFKEFQLAIPNIYLQESFSGVHYHSKLSKNSITGKQKSDVVAPFERSLAVFQCLSISKQIDEKIIKAHLSSFLSKLFMADQDKLEAACQEVCTALPIIEHRTDYEKLSDFYISGNGKIHNYNVSEEQEKMPRVILPYKMLQFSLKTFYKLKNNQSDIVKLWLEHNLICKDVYDEVQSDSGFQKLPVEIIMLIGEYVGFGVDHARAALKLAGYNSEDDYCN